LNSDSILRLVKAGFSENFILDLMKQRPGQFSTSASRIVELKSAGVGERILGLMVAQSGTKDLPSGTQVTIRMIDAIDSEKNSEGDEFRASVEDEVKIGNEVVVPKGADATVKLVAEKESGKFAGRTELTVQLVSLKVDGKTVALDASDVSQKSGSQTADTAKRAAVVGAIGAAIGAIAGGGKGAAICAGAGAGVGAGTQAISKGQRVRIPSETILTFTTQSAVKIP
jgi:hypothetical protein